MVLLAAGIYLHNRPARIAAVALIAVTTFKCFLYDLASLGGLYRVASFVGLAISLALVSLALQKIRARPNPGSASQLERPGGRRRLDLDARVTALPSPGAVGRCMRAALKAWPPATSTDAAAPAVAAPGAPLDPVGLPLSSAAAAGRISGLVTLPLDAAALAHSQGPSALRRRPVVDDRRRQIPYLLERRDEPTGRSTCELRPATPQAPELRAAGQPLHLRDRRCLENLPGPCSRSRPPEQVFRRSSSSASTPAGPSPARARFERSRRPTGSTATGVAPPPLELALPGSARGAAADRRRRGQPAAADDRGPAAASRLAAAVFRPAGPAATALRGRDIGRAALRRGAARAVGHGGGPGDRRGAGTCAEQARGARLAAGFWIGLVVSSWWSCSG